MNRRSQQRDRPDRDQLSEKHAFLREHAVAYFTREASAASGVGEVLQWRADLDRSIQKQYEVCHHLAVNFPAHRCNGCVPAQNQLADLIHFSTADCREVMRRLCDGLKKRIGVLI